MENTLSWWHQPTDHTISISFLTGSTSQSVSLPLNQPTTAIVCNPEHHRHTLPWGRIRVLPILFIPVVIIILAACSRQCQWLNFAARANLPTQWMNRCGPMWSVELKTFANKLEPAISISWVWRKHFGSTFSLILIMSYDFAAVFTNPIFSIELETSRPPQQPAIIYYNHGHQQETAHRCRLKTRRRGHMMVGNK